MARTKATVDSFGDWTIDVDMLGPRLGRVLDATGIWNSMKPGTVYAPVKANDIVRLSHDPDEGDAIPSVAEVVYKAGPRFLSEIECPTDEAEIRLMALTTVLGADIQIIGRDRKGVRSAWILHAEEIDVPAIAQAAGIDKWDTDLRRVPCHLCKVDCFQEAQMYRMVALALVLGAEILYVTRSPHQVVLFHADGVDIPRIAELARIAQDPDDRVQLGMTRLLHSPGPSPSAEWTAGAWGKFSDLEGKEETPET